MESDQQTSPLKTLCKAIQTRDLQAVNKCLESKPSLHQWIDGYEFLTPWHWVHSYGTCDIINALLRAQPDINLRLEHLNGETVLFGAVTKDKLPVVSLLVNSGAEINAVDNNDLTPLHHAISRSCEKEEMIRALLEYGADITAGRDIIDWLQESYPDEEYVFYDVFAGFLDDMKEMNEGLYKKNIVNLAKLAEKHSDLPEDLLDKLEKPQSLNDIKDGKVDNEEKIRSQDTVSTRSHTPPEKAQRVKSESTLTSKIEGSDHIEMMHQDLDI